MNQEILHIQGFQAGAVQAGIRGKERLDLGLIVSEAETMAAGVFTTNLVKAAPVLLDMEHLQAGRARAIVINAGIANACTGEEGMANSQKTAQLVADTLNIPVEEVLVASTGVIGEQLDMTCFEHGIPAAAKKLSADGFEDVSKAIMTTDTVPKTSTHIVNIGGKEIRLLGLAKGAGMIMPDMATMLAFVCTDAAFDSPEVLNDLLRQSVEQTFNRITVDGDTSTNDSVLLLANGLADNTPLGPDSDELAEFGRALDVVLKDLALQIVADGEGANKLVTIKVVGACTSDDAKQAARTIANSPLVKTAFFGEDANWGRIIGALGRSGAFFDPDKVDIAFDDAVMVQDGLGQGAAAEEQASQVLKKDQFEVRIDLKAGKGEAEYYTCDFSLDYVKINADYRT